MIKKIGGGILYVLVWMLLLGVPRIDKISCNVQDSIFANKQNVFETQFCDQFNYLRGRALFFTDFYKTPLYSEAIMDETGRVLRPHSISLIYPNQIKISFLREEPIFRVVANDQTFLVNSAQILVADQTTFELPTVEINHEYSDSFQQGAKVPKEIFQLIASLVKHLEIQQLTQAKIKLDQKGFILYIGRGKYLIDSDAKLAMTIAKTRLIHERLDEIVQDKFTADQKLEIDMRFELPVIRVDNSPT